MAQFDVYINKSPKSRKEIPYLLDVQSDLLSSLDSRVVVPLVKKTLMTPIKYLNPIFKVEDCEVILSTSEISGIPLSVLDKKVTSFKDKRNEIIAALDFLITGF